MHFCSVSQLCPTLCDPSCSTTGFPVLQCLPEFAQNSCPLSRWCHPSISSSVIPFSSCPQSFPPSGSFPVSQFFTSGGQSVGASASASVLPMNIQGWFPLRLTGLISLLSTIIYLCKPSCPWTFHTVTRGDSNAMNTPSCPCAHPSLFPLLVPPRATLQAVEYEYSNFTGYY